MATITKKRPGKVTKNRFIGKPNGQIQERVRKVRPEHFGIISVDCAKRWSKWMLCDFYGKVIIDLCNSLFVKPVSIRARFSLSAQSSIASRCIPIARPMTMISKRSFMPPSMAMDWQLYRSMKTINHCSCLTGIVVTWSSNAHDCKCRFDASFIRPCQVSRLCSRAASSLVSRPAKTSFSFPARFVCGVT
jgi:hypothetical protein